MKYEFLRTTHCDTPQGKTVEFTQGQQVEDKDMLAGVIESLKRTGAVVAVATPPQGGTPKK